MTGRIVKLHGIPPDIHVPVIGEEIRRGWHQEVGRDELPQVRVIVSGIVIHQAAAVEFLAGEAMIRRQGAAAARPMGSRTIAPIALFGDEGAAIVGGIGGAAAPNRLPVAIEIDQGGGVALAHGDALAAKVVVLADG